MSAQKLFRDRVDAGQQLAARLAPYRDESPLVLGLPRGGIPLAYQVARALEAPLDVCVVRKIGAPVQPELGIGAVSEGGVLYVDRETMRHVGVSNDELAELIVARRGEVDERALRFRGGAPPLDVRGRTVIVVDDGVATGGTARAAARTLRARGAARIVLAAPVGAADSLDELASAADDIVCLHAKAAFFAVGYWYRDFTPTTDDEVIELLVRARSEREQAGRPPRQRSERVRRRIDHDVLIPTDEGSLEGRLTIPPEARGLVLFAHGSGSSRRSPRNQHVADLLEREGLATLLFDLLTEREGERMDVRSSHLRFDVDLLASRLVRATDWALEEPETSRLDIGYFGASTGAAAALVAAAARPHFVHAVVSRGGRPDMADGALGQVEAPTLLLVGSLDAEVLHINRKAVHALTGEKRLEIVPGATHLFEEPGALEHVAHSAARWFRRHLALHVLGPLGSQLPLREQPVTSGSRRP